MLLFGFLSFFIFFFSFCIVTSDFSFTCKIDIYILNVWERAILYTVLSSKSFTCRIMWYSHMVYEWTITIYLSGKSLLFHSSHWNRRHFREERERETSNMNYSSKYVVGLTVFEQLPVYIWLVQNVWYVMKHFFLKHLFFLLVFFMLHTAQCAHWNKWADNYIFDCLPF